MYILLNVWLHYEQIIADNHLAAMAIGEIALEDTIKPPAMRVRQRTLYKKITIPYIIGVFKLHRIHIGKVILWQIKQIV